MSSMADPPRAALGPLRQEATIAEIRGLSPTTKGVIPGREANPEVRDSGFDATHRPGMTAGGATAAPLPSRPAQRRPFVPPPPRAGSRRVAATVPNKP